MNPLFEDLHGVEVTSSLVTLGCALLILLTPTPAVAQSEFQISSCDDIDEWSGGTVSSDTVQEGSGSVRWACSEANQLSFDQAIDLSSFNRLRFWLHANHPHAGGGNILLFLGSESSSTDGGDYYSYQIPVDWTGWQELTIPIEALSTVREPRGLDQIENFRLIAEGWGNTRDDTLVLHVDDIRALLVDDHGPLVTEEELLDALELSRSGLEAVRTAHEAGDTSIALNELADYYRARTSPPWWVDPHSVDTGISYDEGYAENTVDGTFTIVGHTYTFPGAGGDVDWSYNPTLDDPGVADNHEWLWQLARMSFWPNLGRAYWATSDERYAQTFADQLESFVVSRPVPDWAANSAGSSWRTIEAGIRMSNSWHDAWNYFLHSSSFTDELLIMMLTSFYEHGVYLRTFQTSGNWVFHELGGLFTVGAIFPEFVEAAEWRTFAATGMRDEMMAQFLADGAQYELSTSYQYVSLHYFIALFEVAALTGNEADVPAEISDRLREAFYWLIRLSTPDGMAPHLNDSADLDVTWVSGRGLDIFPDDELLAWAASGRVEGTPPDWTSVQLWASGYTVLRSGWEADAHYALLDVGPLGYGHDHQDKLNFLLYPYGRRLLFDNGGGNYEASIFRTYGVDTQAHNTVLVDGLPQQRPSRGERAEDDPMGAGDPATPAPIFHSSAEFDYVSGVYQDGYGDVDNVPAVHRREVLFVKPSLFFVVDRLTPNDSESHDYQARWHLLTTNWDEDAGLQSVVTTDADEPNLVVLPLEVDGISVSCASAATSPEVLGWDLGHSGGYYPALTTLHDRSGSGEQYFVTLLYPLAVGETSPIVGVTESSEGTYEVVFDDSSTVTLVLGDGEEGGMTVTIDDGAGGSQTLDVDPGGWVCVDEDGDGYGEPAEACPQGGGDCDDENADVHPGAAERCNGFDDDCDSEIDEGGVCGPCVEGEVRTCYSGPSGTSGVGVCVEGQQTCSGSDWGDCEGEVVPTDELCDDGVDNDCDGLVDDADADGCSDEPPADPDDSSDDDGGCGCRQSGGAAGMPAMLIVFAVAVFWLRIRRE